MDVGLNKKIQKKIWKFQAGKRLKGWSLAEKVVAGGQAQNKLIEIAKRG